VSGWVGGCLGRGRPAGLTAGAAGDCTGACLGAGLGRGLVVRLGWVCERVRWVPVDGLTRWQDRLRLAGWDVLKPCCCALC
jgi:hypothetical protein